MAKDYSIDLQLGIDEIKSLEELKSAIPNIITKAKKELKDKGFALPMELNEAQIREQIKRVSLDLEKGLKSAKIQLAPGIDVEIKKVGDNIKTGIAVNAEQARKAQESLNNSLKKTGNELENLKIKADGAAQRIERTSDTNAKKQIDSLSNSIKKLQSEYTQLGSKADLSKSDVDEFNNKIKRTTTSIQEAERTARQGGNTALSMGEKFKKAATSFMLWQVVTETFYHVKRSLIEGVESIIELDTAMVELIKVTDETNAVYREFRDNSFEVADSIASTAKEVINASAGFARMGYEIEEAGKLGELALIFKNVGDEIDSVDESTSSLIATMKGFNMDAQDATHIVDAVNEVANNFAVTAGDLSSGIERVSSVMSQSNVGFEQTLGLITGATEVIQNAEKASTGLRTISERIRGITTESDDFSQLTPKLEAAFNSIGVGLKDNEGQIRDTYSILQDLAAVYPMLDQNTKQYIAELSAGKRQINTFNAIMMNFESVQRATATALDSAGSAAQEQEACYNSLQGTIERISNRISQFWAIVVNDQAMKNLLNSLLGLADSFVDNADSASRFINILADLVDMLTALNDKIGLLEIGFSALLTKGVLSTVAGFLKFDSATAMAAAGVAKLAGTTGTLTVATKALQGALGVGLIGALFLVITAVVDLVNQSAKLKQKFENLDTGIKEVSQNVGIFHKHLIAENISEYSGAIAEAEASIASLKEELGLATDASLRFVLAQKTEELERKTKGLGSYSSAVKNLEREIDVLNKLISEEERLTRLTTQAKEEEYNANMAVLNSQDMLVEATRQSTKTGYVQKELFEKLIDIYPELANSAILTANGYKIEANTMVSATEVKLKALRAEASADAKVTQQIIANVKKRIDAYATLLKAEQASGRHTTMGLRAEVAWRRSSNELDRLNARLSSQQNVANKINTTLGKLSGNISSIGGSYSNVASASKSQNTSTEKSIDLLQERSKLEQEIMSAILERIKKEQEEKTQILDNKLENLKSQLDRYKEINKQQQENAKNELENIKETNQKRQNALKSEYDKTLSILRLKKESYQTEKDMLQIEYDKRKEDENIQDLEEQLRLQQERINILKQDPTRISEVVEAEKQMTEIRKQLSDALFDKQYNEAQMVLDNKISAIELEEQAAENTYEKQKSLLDSQLANAELAYNKQISLLESQADRYDETINAQISKLEEQKVAIQSQYEEMISNSNNYWNEVESIMKRKQSSIINFLKQTDQYRQAGQAQRQAYVQGWQETMANITSAGGSISTGGASGGTSSSSSFPYGKASATSGNIRTGATGTQVKAIQWALKQMGYKLPKYGVDGKFGAETANAVKQFQKDMKIAVDGVVGKSTRSKFKSKGYQTGGINTSAGYHMLHGTPTKPEYVLNYEQMRGMMSGNIPSFVKPSMPSGSTTNNNINPIINVTLNGSNLNANDVANKIGQKFIDIQRKYTGGNGLVKAGL
jgi:TP901 family phage tail tape measure protein